MARSVIEIIKESDGTFTIKALSFFEMEMPLRGIPSFKLAQQIIEALYEAERAGAQHYAESEY